LLLLKIGIIGHKHINIYISGPSYITIGNRREAIIDIKATFSEEFNSTYDIKAAIPIATFSP
jgi:hypothetical protein